MAYPEGGDHRPAVTAPVPPTASRRAPVRIYQARWAQPGTTQEEGIVRRTQSVLAALVVATALVAVEVTSGSARTTRTFMNSHASVQARVGDLLSRMTLQEKIGQMDQIVVGRLRAAGDPRQRRLQRRQHDAAAAELPAEACWSPTTRARSCPAAPTTRLTTPGTAGRTCTTPSSITRSSTRGCTSRSSTASTPFMASATRPTRR